MRTLVVFSLFVLLHYSSMAQSLELTSSAGLLIPHRMSMRGLVEKPAHAIQFSYGPKVRYQDVHKNNNKPKLIVSGLYQGFGNPTVLGQAYALSASMRFFKRLGENCIWSNSLSTGIGYFSKKFDPVTNNKNIAIGSHINSFESLSTSLIFGKNRLFGGGGFSVVHFSNGRAVTPNLGLNLIHFHGRLIYQMESDKSNVSPDVSTPKRLDGFSFATSFGVNQRTKPGGPTYGAFNFRSLYQWGIMRSSFTGLAIDAMYSGHNQSILSDEGRSADFGDVLQIGVSGFFTYQLDDVLLEFGPGVYIYDQAKINAFHYFKFRLYWMTTDSFGVSFGLKTHGATADYNEIGMTYVF